MRTGRLLLAAAAAAAWGMIASQAAWTDVSENPYSAALEADFRANRLYKVPLGQEVLEKCAPDLADLRLYDNSGMEIPYVVLEDVKPSGGIIMEKYELEVTGFHEGGAEMVITARLPEQAQPVRVLYFDITEKDFHKDVIVSASADGQAWQEIGRGAIYDFTSKVSLRKTEVRIPENSLRWLQMRIVQPGPLPAGENRELIELEYKNLKLNINDFTKTELRINRIVARTAPEAPKEEKGFDEKVCGDLESAVDESGRTLVDVPCFGWGESLTLTFRNAFFFREVYVFEGRTPEECREKLRRKMYISCRTISTPLGEADGTSGERTIDIPSRKYDFLLLAVENEDNPALEFQEVRIRWVKKNLFFAAPSSSRSYKLFFGNPGMEKPSYEMRHVITRNNWYRQDFSSCRISEIEKNPFYQQRLSRMEKEKIRKVFLSVFTLAMAAGLGFWLYRLSKSTKAPG
jgi:hypothetical protein